jgi:O-antigen/teichoic acid export membrane protein
VASQKQAALGAFWGTVERAATQGISFLVVLVLARLLGPENYGLVTLAATIALLGQMLLGETFSEALVQAKTLEAEHVSTLFWVLLGASLSAAASIMAAADFLSLQFEQPQLAPILRALSPLLVVTALQAVPAALFKRDLNFRALAVASTSGTVMGGLAGMTLAFAGFGPWSLVANLLTQNTIIAATIWRQSRFRPSFIYSHRHLRDLWSYGQYTFLLRIAAFTANQSPRILIGYLFGPAALGAFSLGLRIIEVMIQLLTLPSANVAVPVIAKVREEPQRLERAILSATQLTALTSAPAFFGLAAIAPILVPLVFGGHWTQSVPIVQILAIYGVVVSYVLIWNGIIGGLGRPDINLTTSVIAAVLSVSLVLLASRWGLMATSLVFVIRGYVIAPLQPFFISRLTGIRAVKQFRVLGPIVLAAAGMALAVESLLAGLGDVLTPIFLAPLAIAVGGTVYGLGLLLFARSAIRLGISILGDLRPRQKAA